MAEPRWDKDIYRPLLVIVTSASLVAALTKILASRLPAWPIILGHPAIIFLISMESYATTRFAHSCRFYRLGFHLKEWLILAIILRTSLLLISGLPEIAFGEGILVTVESILGALLFQPAFMLNLALLYTTWRLANLYSRDLLALDLVSTAAEGKRPEFEKAQFVSSNHLYQQVWSRYAKGALLVITALGLSWRFGPAQEEGLRSASWLGILYLVSGWLMVSQAYLLNLRLDWLKERMAPSPALLSRITGEAFALMGLLSGVALLLPVVRWPFSLPGVVNWLAGLASRLFQLLESLGGPEVLRDYLARSGLSTKGQALRRLPELSGYIYALALGLLFLVLAVLAYLAFKKGVVRSGKTALSRTLARMPASFGLVGQMVHELLTPLFSLPGFIVLLLKELAKWFIRALPEGASQIKAQGDMKLRPQGQREVASFYLTFLRYLQAKGLYYKRSMTPYEIARIASGWYQASAPDISCLTEAFVKWRYGQKSLEQEQIEAARRSLRRFKAASRLDKSVGVC